MPLTADDTPVVCHYDPIHNDSQVMVIEPGMVLIRNFLPDDDCRKLADMASQWGEQGEDGFFTKTENGSKALNTGDAGRGRIYDNIKRFPPKVVGYCNQAVSMATEADTEMPNMVCTHLLLNMYTSSNGLVWHRDIYENDGKSDHPVVNLCVGASCRFGIKHEDDDPERVITLCSGDCLLFGGPCRLIKHAVLEVLLDQCPQWMAQSPKRFSFTFRDSPEVLGREHEFKYFKVNEHLVGQEDFTLPLDPKDRRGLPSQKSQRSLRSVMDIASFA